jgi:magnesium transporter
MMDTAVTAELVDCSLYELGVRKPGDRLLVYRTAACAHDGGAEFGELDVFLGKGYVIAVRHGRAGDPATVRRRLDSRPELVGRGPAAVVWGILDTVVDDYSPVVEAIEAEIESLDQAIFGGTEDLTERIYGLLRPERRLARPPHRPGDRVRAARPRRAAGAVRPARGLVPARRLRRVRVPYDHAGRRKVR